MKRKTFIKTSSALALGGLISPLSSCKNQTAESAVPAPEVRTNWAGNYTYKAEKLHLPKTSEEVQQLVQSLNKQKALGSCHCFNNIADSPKNQISTKELNKVIEIDEANKTISLEAGAKYGELAPVLQEKGFALHNLASLPHISVAGACATATHGSGVENGNLATAVNALEMVNGKGELIQLSREKDGDLFNGAIVGLGALGIVTKMSLDIQTTFDVRQDVFQELPLAALEENFEAILSSGYSVSLFTDWTKKLVSQVWVKRRTDEAINDLGTDFYGAKAAVKDLHPITRLSAVHCTEQMGIAGPWHERLPHFKMGFTPSSGEELQSEYFVPFENGLDAMLALEKKAEQIFPHLFISEIRTIAADNLWMSPCYQQKCLAIHFTWKQNWEAVQKLLPMIEAELAPYNVRPHWGKLFTIDPAILQSRYVRYNDFINLVKTHDPEGKFRNAYLDLNIYKA